MYKISRIFKCFFISTVFIFFGCSTSIPIFERKQDDSVIRENMVADYDLNGSKLVMSGDNTSSNSDVEKIRGFLSSLVETFSKNLGVNSKNIKKITLDKEFQYIRVELKNCKFYVVNFENVKNQFTVIDSGIMGPCY